MESLRRMRREKGLSQQELADRAKVGQDSISAIETGKHEPHPRTMRKLAKALGVEVAEFFREPVTAGKAEAPEAGPSKPFSHRYAGARKGIEAFCDHWERRLEAGDLPREALEELRAGIESFNPVIDALVAAELRDLARLHHGAAGEPLVDNPFLALPRKLRDGSTLEAAANRYIGVCLKAMRTRAREAGADPEQDADVINLEEFRDAFLSRTG